MQTYPFLRRKFLVPLGDQLAILLPRTSPVLSRRSPLPVFPTPRTSSPFFLSRSSLATTSATTAVACRLLRRAILLHIRGYVIIRLPAEARSRRPLSPAVVVAGRQVGVGGSGRRTRRLRVGDETAAVGKGCPVAEDGRRRRWRRRPCPVASRTPRRVVHWRRRVVEGVQLPTFLRRLAGCRRTAALVHVPRPSVERERGHGKRNMQCV